MHHALWLIPSLTRCSEGSLNVNPEEIVLCSEWMGALRSKLKKWYEPLGCVATFLSLRLNPIDLKWKKRLCSTVPF